MPDPFLLESPHIKAVMASLFGGFVSKRFRRGMSLSVWLFTIASLVGMAYIFAIPIALAFGDIRLVAVVGCTIGMFGLPICESIADSIPKIDIAGIIKSRLGGN